MGRASNPGGPQRVSAHVLPKAQASSFADDDDEKTTIESQWEEEASTTVEQGDVADKIRSLDQARRPITGVTNTGAGQLEEPTVDDQHANPALLLVPQAALARLVIAQGNDAGRELDLVPGKTFTIGRAVDNDVVLTDIAVSRKHFDLRHEDGSWVIVDRGSGNGTVVNGNIEDNPFMLANGDTIEIGNTLMRFDQENGAPRAESFHVDIDEEEASTVAGKPMRGEIEVATPQEVRTPIRERPKTLPPPTPIRPRGQTQQPFYAPVQAPASTLPMPQSNRPPAQAMPQPTFSAPQHRGPLPGVAPVSTPHAPTLLAERPIATPMSQPSQLPTTLPGPAPVRPGPAFGYPQLNDIPPQQIHAQMLLIHAQQGSRGDGSTAHVPPMSYSNGYSAPQPLVMVPARYAVPPVITKRMKAIMIGAGITVLAAILALGIIRSSRAKVPSTAGKAGSSTTVAKTMTPTPAPPPKQVVAQDPPKQVAAPSPPPTAPPKQDPPKQVAQIAPPPPPPTPPKQDPPKLITPPPPPPAPPKQDPPKQVAQDPPKQDPGNRSAKTTKRPTSQPSPPKPRVAAEDDPPPPPPPPPKATGGVDVLEQGTALCKQRRLREAANLLKSAAVNEGDKERQSHMRTNAALYSKLEGAVQAGESSSTSTTDAFEMLRSAINYDKATCSAYADELGTKLGEIAPKAAVTYFATKKYDKAHDAVIAAGQVGAGGNANVKIVHQSLEAKAGELYAQADKEFENNAADARAKLQTIEKMVDAKSPWYTKARQRLGPD